MSPISRYSHIWCATLRHLYTLLRARRADLQAAKAPCAASAINDNVQYQTDENCPEATDALQSCVCSKNNNFASISAGVISSVKYSCGSTATDDMASASTVLSAYCNQNTAVAFPTPTNLVSLYITDVPEISYLGGCASSILSEVVMGLTEEACPSDATAMATCAYVFDDLDLHLPSHADSPQLPEAAEFLGHQPEHQQRGQDGVLKHSRCLISTGLLLGLLQLELGHFCVPCPRPSSGRQCVNPSALVLMQPPN